MQHGGVSERRGTGEEPRFKSLCGLASTVPLNQSFRNNPADSSFTLVRGNKGKDFLKEIRK